jgi:hypothetical protein
VVDGKKCKENIEKKENVENNVLLKKNNLNYNTPSVFLLSLIYVKYLIYVDEKE